ncbi:MAG: 23S rRNA (adenine(2503)-C(2))-methyltransferase RlmN [Patescibacteria group bacterium]|nr:23S rRNA (adenine(2503)-C(2))-methyltransferase RlmN [Patescibacteria group bacterium]MDD4610354.1 23S rRNA (adenine(2503)-C(2))-methyltransferase RlmN [Patescibacteria group bacterium]
MNLGNLNVILKSFPSFRFKQAEEAIYKNLISNWNESNLPKELKELLSKECPLEIKAELLKSKDGKTYKALINLEDENAIETVLMRHKDDRNTVCVSSQVGCALGCDFCATGKSGFKRNLTSGEIIEQVLFFARFLKKEGQAITNVVFMGMGEPLLNYDEVIRAIKIINDKNKFNIGARKISVSTVGIIEGIKKLTKEPLQINLALSLHAPDDKLRNELMPINNKYPLKKILSTIKEYIARTNRKVMIEYLMLENINDYPEQAVQLAELLNNNLESLYFVNLISYNPTGIYKPSRSERIEKFKENLEKCGVDAIQRYRYGVDIKGACGQLAGKRRTK